MNARRRFFGILFTDPVSLLRILSATGHSAFVAKVDTIVALFLCVFSSILGYNNQVASNQ